MLEKLVLELTNSLDTKDQELINEKAKALADYLWKEDLDISYEDLLEGLCYKKEEKINGISKQI